MKFCKSNNLDEIAAEMVSFCCDAILRHYPQKDIIAFILTGSFSRGEGSLIKSAENKFIVLGDIEFMVVFPSNDEIPKKYLELNEIAKQISKSLLLKGIQCDVDLGPIAVSYFENAKPTIFNIELRDNGKVIYGDKYVLNRMPNFTTADILQWDAFALLSNRIIEQLILYEKIMKSTNLTLYDVNYQITKLYIDLGGSFLAFSGNYETTYAGRVSN